MQHACVLESRKM